MSPQCFWRGTQALLTIAAYTGLAGTPFARAENHLFAIHLECSTQVSEDDEQCKSISRSHPDGDTIRIVRKAVITANDLVDVKMLSSAGEWPVLSIKFDVAGRQRFKDVTAHNIGRNLVVLVNAKIVSVATIREAIEGGSGQLLIRLSHEDVRAIVKRLEMKIDARQQSVGRE